MLKIKPVIIISILGNRVPKIIEAYNHCFFLRNLLRYNPIIARKTETQTIFEIFSMVNSIKKIGTIITLILVINADLLGVAGLYKIFSHNPYIVPLF